ncbi:hypothetical protein CFOL_v3_22202, partial [Cephalotus follicularis]
YLARFNKESLQVRDLEPSFAVTALLSGLKKTQFKFSLMKKNSANMEELLKRAEKYINAEEAMNTIKIKALADSGKVIPKGLHRVEEKRERKKRIPKCWWPR